MWTLETIGNGRRAIIQAVHDDHRRFELNDFVNGDTFCGIIAGFRSGETEASHTVRILLFEPKETELFATSIFKTFALNELQSVGNLATMGVKRAIFHPFRTREIIADLPPNFEFQTADELAKTVISLFTKSSPVRKRTPVLNRESPCSTLLLADATLIDSDSSSEFQDSEEESLIPARKRIQKTRSTKKGMKTIDNKSTMDNGLSDAMAAASLKSPVKTPKSRNKNKQNQCSEIDQADLKQKMPSKSTKKLNLLGAIDDDADLVERTDSDSETGDLDLSQKLVTESSEQHKGFSELKQIPQVVNQLKITPIDVLLSQLHPASDPATHPCRENQYDQLFIALESAISAETGTCIYVSGTPGTGKTSTIREVIGQLDLRVSENELTPFTFLEINGMKLVHPNAAYEYLWEALGRGQMAASNAMTALESTFSVDEDRKKRGVMVVLLDEIDQLVTKGQQLMYNFFNWPSLPHSRLVVIAVANTMDLPERMLSNKISSRVGLTRVQFPGYTYEELLQIVTQRLENTDYSIYVEPEALEYAARKVASVGGDARRVLDFVRQSLETAVAQHTLPVKTSHIRDVIVHSQTPPLAKFLSSLGLSAKTFLCALLARTRRTNNTESSIHDILQQADQLVKSSSHSHVLLKYLYNNSSQLRLNHFQTAVMELIECGILVQQVIKGEATPMVRLMVPASSIKEHLEKDRILGGMV